MGTKSEQLEREAHQTRHRLSETLDELRARITPGQLVDQLADYAREGPAAEFFRNLARDVRENPLPLTLIGIGVAWMIIATIASRRLSATREVYEGEWEQRPARTVLREPECPLDDTKEAAAMLASAAEGRPQTRIQA
jgi:hypothetical protein